MKPIVAFILIISLSLDGLAKSRVQKPKTSSPKKISKHYQIFTDKNGTTEIISTPKIIFIRTDRNGDGIADRIHTEDENFQSTLSARNRGIYQLIQTRQKLKNGFQFSTFLFRPSKGKYELFDTTFEPFKTYFHETHCEPNEAAITRLNRFFENVRDPLNYVAFQHYDDDVDQNCAQNGFNADHRAALVDGLAALSLDLENDNSAVTGCLAGLVGDPLSAYRMRGFLMQLRDRNFELSRPLITCQRDQNTHPASFNYSTGITIHHPPENNEPRHVRAWAVNVLSHELLHRSGVSGELQTATAVRCCIHADDKDTTACRSNLPELGYSDQFRAAVDEFKYDPYVLELLAYSRELSADARVEFLRRLDEIRLRAKTALFWNGCLPNETKYASNQSMCQTHMQTNLQNMYTQLFAGDNALCRMLPNQQVCAYLSHNALKPTIIANQTGRCIGVTNQVQGGDCTFGAPPGTYDRPLVRADRVTDTKTPASFVTGTISQRPESTPTPQQPMAQTPSEDDDSRPTTVLTDEIAAATRNVDIDDLNQAERITYGRNQNVTISGSQTQNGAIRTGPSGSSDSPQIADPNAVTRGRTIDLPQTRDVTIPETATPQQNVASRASSMGGQIADTATAQTTGPSRQGTVIDPRNTEQAVRYVENAEQAGSRILEATRYVATAASDYAQEYRAPSGLGRGRSSYQSEQRAYRPPREWRNTAAGRADMARNGRSGSRPNLFGVEIDTAFNFAVPSAGAAGSTQAATSSLGIASEQTSSGAPNGGGFRKVSSRTTTTTTNSTETTTSVSSSGGGSSSFSAPSGGSPSRSTASATPTFDRERARRALEKNWQEFSAIIEDNRRAATDWLVDARIEIIKGGRRQFGSRNPQYQYIFPRDNDLARPRRVVVEDD